MRIAQVTFACNKRGGIERVVFELSRRLARSHEVHIFAGACELEQDGIVFHRVPTLRWPWAFNLLGYFITTARAVARLGARSPFDIVHVQGVPSALASDVTTAHSVHCRGTARQKEFLSAWQRGWRYVKTVEPLVMWLTGYNFRPSRCRRVIAISRRVRDEVSDAFGMPPERIEVIPNGVDIEEFRPVESEEAQRDLRARLGLPAGRVVALFVANDFKWKGLDTLLVALSRMERKARPLLLVAGDSRDSILSLRRCRSIAGCLGLTGDVRFLGAVTDPAACYRAADFFVLPTVYDAFGIAILEALSSGLPAIFSRLAGASDIVQHARDAMLLDDPTDPVELAFRMGQLASSAGLRREIGRAARATALRYSWDRIADLTLECYAEVLSEKATERRTVRSMA